MERQNQTINDPDSILVKKSQQGDAEAFKMLILKYQQPMINLLFHLTNDYDSSQDLAQELFIRTFRGINGFKGRSAFSTWLYRIAINIGITHNKAKQRRDKVFSNRNDRTDEGQEEFNQPKWSETPETVLQNLELSRHIEKALEDLNENQRAIIMLRDIEGVSHEEIAEVFNCPIGTFRSRLARARQTLKMKLKPYL